MDPILQLIDDNFDRATFERAQSYANAHYVKLTTARDDVTAELKIKSSVFGSAGQSYKQDILVDVEGNNVEGDCTCPVGYNCKHVLAAVMVALGIPARVGKQSQATKLVPPSAPLTASTPLPYQVEAWLLNLAKASRSEEEAYGPEVTNRLLYVFEPAHAGENRDLVMVVRQARLLKSGEYSGATAYNNTNALYNPPRFMLSVDQRILRELVAISSSGYGFRFNVQLISARLMEQILATRRAHWQDVRSPPLTWAEMRPMSITWATLANGDRRPNVAVTPQALVLATTPPTYLDTVTHEAGHVETALKPTVAAAIVAAPVLPAALVTRVSEEIQARNLFHLIAPPAAMEEVTLFDYEPTIVLTLATMRQEYMDTRTWRHVSSFVDCATLGFEYLGQMVSAKLPAEITRVTNAKLERVHRQHTTEKRARTEIRAAGLEPIEKILQTHTARNLQGRLVMSTANNEAANTEAWTKFMETTLATLRAYGWRVVMDPSFRFNLAKVDDWYADVDESQNAWFDLEIGIEIEGQRVSLIPILVKLIRATPAEWKGEALAARSDDEQVLVPLPDGRRAVLPMGRIRPLVTTLYELFMREPTGEAIRLTKFDAARLAEMEGAIQCRWLGGERLRDLGARLARFSGITPVTAPKNFKADLRPYQAEGLSWLQFLREYEMGGVLADDMGLGKTVQTLAHILCEKQAGRLGTPALVVAPTSMIGTWQSEAKRFAPSLSVWVSHGGERHKGADNMAKHDIVLTTYALLSRDADVLKKTTWHLLILDEAQNIKNPKTHAAVIACTLEAKHRLCLSGTPLENHLGELWSLFQFLSPGFLGDEKSFQRDYRKPIEKEGDSDRRKFLARRIKPFMLRRTKDMVASELPPKTLITRVVEMEARQSDLYETIRAAMDKRVRDEIASKGLARSHIVVLDALLKLRQVCCDPRLLKTVSAKNAASAKLESLMEMLDELLEEGRHILLFSQFTSMLTLIEAELDARKLKYVKLTGSTRDRATPIDEFQSGRVKLFLISLKAGGTGLTLTAADTVIHYDPWWNPAVENQATDRAHRIGQTKPVFVYKLITKGTVEERIVELQSRKGALASELLGGEAKAVSGLGAEDLKALFEPLPML